MKVKYLKSVLEQLEDDIEIYIDIDGRKFLLDYKFDLIFDKDEPILIFYNDNNKNNYRCPKCLNGNTRVVGSSIEGSSYTAIIRCRECDYLGEING